MQNLEGLQLGRFQIEKLLGMGGFGVVYRAFDLIQQRTVAVKLLAQPWLGDEKVVTMFKREGEIALRLHHPNLVSAFETGQIYGQPYYQMEYFPGLPLNIAMTTPDSPNRNTARLCNVLRQVAAALGYLHGQGLVHRDLKPGNILVDDNGMAKLLDLGLIVSITGAALRDAERVGTPRYMAPEQKSGKPVDARADIYALAVVAAEMLSELCATRQQPTDPPPGVRLILKQAQAIDPRRRPSDIVRFADVLCEALERPEALHAEID